MLESTRLPKDKILYKKGAPPTHFLYIVKGSVDLMEAGRFGDLVVKQVKAGSAVGVSSYFTHEARWYTAKCAEDSDVISVRQENIDRFVSDYPLAVLHILKSLSEELDVEDKKLLEMGNGQGSRFDESKHFTISTIDDMAHIDTNRAYRMPLPQKHMDYLFSKEVVCPVCGELFKASQVRYSQLEVKEHAEDFRKITNHIDPLWYDVWRCPHCDYANFQSEFMLINNKLREELNQLLPKAFKRTDQSVVKENISEVFDDYFAMERIMKKTARTPFVKARWWQSLAWMLEDVGDDQAALEARKVLRTCYEDAWYNGSDGLMPDDDLKLSIKLALLLQGEQELNLARSYLLKGLQLEGTSPVMRKQAQDKLYELKELYLQNKQAE